MFHNNIVKISENLDARPPRHRYSKGQIFSVKKKKERPEIQFYPKSAGNYVVTGKYIEEAQQLKLQPAIYLNISNH